MSILYPPTKKYKKGQRGYFRGPFGDENGTKDYVEVEVVRQSERTGSLTVQIIDKPKGTTVVIMPYEFVVKSGEV